MRELINNKLKILPLSSGCYIMKNKNKNIIYIGKAKNLRNRVSSYFIGKHDLKTSLLIKEVNDFEYICTNSETEALILENQLIKVYKPKFNILLKDDKMYPYIVITKEKFPRLITTRKPNKKEFLKVFGPYTDSSDTKKTIEILNYIYPLRKCKVIPNKSCLYFHINQCVAPCIFDIDEDKYLFYIKEIIDFLNGKTKKVITYLNEKMFNSSEKLEFEKALVYRNMLNSLEKIFNVDNSLFNIYENSDFIGYCYNEKYLCIQIFHVRSAKIVKRDSDIFMYINDIESSLESYLLQFYTSENNILPKNIYIKNTKVCKNLKNIISNINIFIPKRGNKKKLLDLVQVNCAKQLEEKKLIIESLYDRTFGAINILGDILNIPSPNRIEMIDNSNISNNSIVSAVVVYINGVPSKKDYRKYKINIKKMNDYQVTREVVYRRYNRMINERKNLPDLVIIDGGKSHLNCVYEIFKKLNISLPVIALTKDKNHRTSGKIVTKDKIIEIKKNSNIYKLLSNIQEEAHRFVINFHRLKRSNSLFSTELDNIKLIGEKTKNKLLQNFNLEEIKNMSIKELEKVVNKRQAQNIFEYFKKEDN